MVPVGGWAETGGCFDDSGRRVGSGGFHSMATDADGPAVPGGAPPMDSAGRCEQLVLSRLPGGEKRAAEYRRAAQPSGPDLGAQR